MAAGRPPGHHTSVSHSNTTATATASKVSAVSVLTPTPRKADSDTDTNANANANVKMSGEVVGVNVPPPSAQSQPQPPPPVRSQPQPHSPIHAQAGQLHSQTQTTARSKFADMSPGVDGTAATTTTTTTGTNTTTAGTSGANGNMTKVGGSGGGGSISGTGTTGTAGKPTRLVHPLSQRQPAMMTSSSSSSSSSASSPLSSSASSPASAVGGGGDVGRVAVGYAVNTFPFPVTVPVPPSGTPSTNAHAPAAPTSAVASSAAAAATTTTTTTTTVVVPAGVPATPTGTSSFIVGSADSREGDWFQRRSHSGSVSSSRRSSVTTKRLPLSVVVVGNGNGNGSVNMMNGTGVGAGGMSSPSGGVVSAGATGLGGFPMNHQVAGLLSPRGPGLLAGSQSSSSSSFIPGSNTSNNGEGTGVPGGGSGSGSGNNSGGSGTDSERISKASPTLRTVLLKQTSRSLKSPSGSHPSSVGRGESPVGSHTTGDVLASALAYATTNVPSLASALRTGKPSSPLGTAFPTTTTTGNPVYTIDVSGAGMGGGATSSAAAMMSLSPRSVGDGMGMSPRGGMSRPVPVAAQSATFNGYSNSFIIRLASADLAYQAPKKKPKFVQNYFMGDILGRGASSKVREAYCVDDLKRVAVKIIKRKILMKIRQGSETGEDLVKKLSAQTLFMKTARMSDNVCREITLLTKLKHRNVINLIEVMYNREKEKIYMVFEYCPGRLQQMIERAPKGRLPLSQAQRYFGNLMDGLEYLHSHGVIHRDIKPANLLICRDNLLKITDFGISEIIDTYSKTDTCTTDRGTPMFLAPEVADSSSMIPFSGSKVDIWSAGVTLFNMVTGTYPMVPSEGTNIYGVFALIVKCEHVYPTFVVPPLKSLLEGILTKDPAKRLSIAEMRAHPWMQEVYVHLEAEVPLTSELSLLASSFSIVTNNGAASPWKPSVTTGAGASAGTGAGTAVGASAHVGAGAATAAASSLSSSSSPTTAATTITAGTAATTTAKQQHELSALFDADHNPIPQVQTGFSGGPAGEPSSKSETASVLIHGSYGAQNEFSAGPMGDPAGVTAASASATSSGAAANHTVVQPATPSLHSRSPIAASTTHSVSPPGAGVSIAAAGTSTGHLSPMFSLPNLSVTNIRQFLPPGKFVASDTSIIPYLVAWLDQQKAADAVVTEEPGESEGADDGAGDDASGQGQGQGSGNETQRTIMLVDDPKFHALPGFDVSRRQPRRRESADERAGDTQAAEDREAEDREADVETMIDSSHDANGGNSNAMIHLKNGQGVAEAATNATGAAGMNGNNRLTDIKEEHLHATGGSLTPKSELSHDAATEGGGGGNGAAFGSTESNDTSRTPGGRSSGPNNGGGGGGKKKGKKRDSETSQKSQKDTGKKKKAGKETSDAGPDQDRVETPAKSRKHGTGCTLQ